MDIPAIAQAATDTAWAAIATVLQAVTLRDKPTFAHSASTDLDTVSAWGVTIATNAFIYDDEKTQRDTDAPLEGKVKSAIFRRADLTGVTEITTAAELTIGADTWHVTSAENPPGEAIFILRLRR